MPNPISPEVNETLAGYRDAARQIVNAKPYLAYGVHPAYATDSLLEQVINKLHNDIAVGTLSPSHLEPGYDVPRLESLFDLVQEVRGALNRLATLNPEWDLDWVGERILKNAPHYELNGLVRYLQSEPALSQQVADVRDALDILSQYNDIRQNARTGDLDETALKQHAEALQTLLKSVNNPNPHHWQGVLYNNGASKSAAAVVSAA